VSLYLSFIFYVCSVEDINLRMHTCGPQTKAVSIQVMHFLKPFLVYSYTQISLSIRLTDPNSFWIVGGANPTI
jgi:hypothetical protein